MFETPVLFLVFNRLGTTKQVFEKIRELRPKNLYIAADGPRVEKKDEVDKCNSVRNFIVQNIDWDCKIKTLFRDNNLGCKIAVSQAITWFFENVEQGIVLEDDCLPGKNFFYFCENLLNFYKHDNQIMHISGSNLINENQIKDSYYFSKYPCAWGWATWKRAWLKYDIHLKDWNTKKTADFADYYNISLKELTMWNKEFAAVKKGLVNTWDTQWQYSIWVQNGISITPGVNLISNIGFGVPDATHTIGDAGLSMPIKNICADDLIHPTNKKIKITFDEKLFNTVYLPWSRKKTLKQHLHDNFYRYLPEILKNKYKRIKYIFGNDK